MKQITIGTEGNQPFKIKSSGVSRNHARLTVNDDGAWLLEDLNSTNGTYVRGIRGDEQRISKIEINDMTFVRLGPDNVNGCCFYARQLLAPGDYTKEFEYLNEIEDIYEAKELRNDRISKYVRWFVGLVSGLAFIVSAIGLVKGRLELRLLRAGSFVSAVISFVYDPAARKKNISRDRNKFYRCPNPACSHILSSKEIRNMQCSKCKAK